MFTAFATENLRGSRSPMHLWRALGSSEHFLISKHALLPTWFLNTNQPTLTVWVWIHTDLTLNSFKYERFLLRRSTTVWSPCLHGVTGKKVKQDDTNFRSMLHFCRIRASFTFDSNKRNPSLFQTLKKLEQVGSVIPWEENAMLFPNSLGLKISIIHPAQDCEGWADTQLWIWQRISPVLIN